MHVLNTKLPSFCQHNTKQLISLERLCFQFAGLCQPVGKKVKEKIKELVSDGVTKVSEMKRHIKIYVKDEGMLNESLNVNRRFNPSDKDLRNHMEIARRKFRFVNF